MKIYTNKTTNNFTQYKKDLVSKPDKIETTLLDNKNILLNRFNDQNIIFKAKPTVTMKIQAGKSKLLNQFNEILSTDISRTSIEDEVAQIVKSAYIVIKQRHKQLDNLYFQAEAIMANKVLSPKQKYDAFNEIDKKIKNLEKNMDKPP